MKPLTPKEALFVAHYLKSLNATQAAIEARYSRKTAKQIGSQLLAKPHIIAAIAAKQAPSLSKLDLTAEGIKEEIRRLAHFDPALLFDATGKLLHLKDMPPEVRACVKSVEVLKRNTTAGDGQMDEVYKVQFWDKPSALQMAAKHLLLLVDTVKHEHRFPHAELTDAQLDEQLLLEAEKVTLRLGK